MLSNDLRQAAEACAHMANAPTVDLRQALIRAGVMLDSAADKALALEALTRAAIAHAVEARAAVEAAVKPPLCARVLRPLFAAGAQLMRFPR